ncbi:hypothetical protein ACDF64_11640 [Agromyces sp. MMS24-JH15]|uniref:hypothetical protein n=1 Tax=Agromyces sp. MMS24-JH15 TaxID=3243765 RepID=UPI0037489E0D
MEALPEAQLSRLGDDGAAAAVLADRRVPPVQVLRELIAHEADVPAEDVELAFACAECGARHGRPEIDYPSTPSGAGWFGDVLHLDGTTVAVAGSHHRLGLGLVRPGAGGPLIDQAALNPLELAAVADHDEAARPRARARAWARKAALVRALGHSDLQEPSGIALATTDDEPGVACVVRTAPEIGSQWRGIRVHDLDVGDGLVAAVAVLP